MFGKVRYVEVSRNVKLHLRFEESTRRNGQLKTRTNRIIEPNEIMQEMYESVLEGQSS